MLKNNGQLSRGFTIVELIIVLVLLAILASFAIPRYIDMRSIARKTVIRGVAASLNSAAVTVHGYAVLTGNDTGFQDITPTGMFDKQVAVYYGYPLADKHGTVDGILNAVQYDNEALEASVTGQTLTLAFKGTTNCKVTYQWGPASSPNPAPPTPSVPTGGPVITSTLTGC